MLVGVTASWSSQRTEPPPAVEPEPEPAAPAAEQPAQGSSAVESEAAPVAEQPAEPPPAVQPEPAAPAAEQPAAAHEQTPVEPPPVVESAGEQAPAAEAAGHQQQQPEQQQPAEGQRRSGQRRRRRGGGNKEGAPRPPRQGGGGRPQREKGPLPFPELRAAAETMRDVLGQRRALRDAFTVLGDKERQDLSRLVSEDGDWRVRARNIAAGSLGAGRLGKAIAAQGISMANIEDLWNLTLSKEEAAERTARIRDAKRRDERRAKRHAERQQSSDRVSRAELEKAQDGRVGAQVRIVFENQKGGRRTKGDEEETRPKGGNDVLDRLGY